MLELRLKTSYRVSNASDKFGLRKNISVFFIEKMAMDAPERMLDEVKVIHPCWVDLQRVAVIFGIIPQDLAAAPMVEQLTENRAGGLRYMYRYEHGTPFLLRSTPNLRLRGP